MSIKTYILPILLFLSISVLPARASEEPPNTVREVVLLHMADTHAALEVHPEIFFDDRGNETFRPAGGFALLAAAIERERKAAPDRTLLINVGDTIHGSAVAEWTEGAAIVPIVNALGIDAFVPGNWEYAYGPEVFRKRMAELNHPVIALNVRDEETGEALFAPSVVRTINDVRVAIVGITSLIVDKSMAPDYSRGLKFSFREGLQEEVDRLRAEGADIVILATELGLAQEVRLSREIEGVDFIFGGHTHERTSEPITDGGIPIIQSGSEGSFLSRVRFRVADGKVMSADHELLKVTPENYEPEPRIAELVERAQRPYRDRLDRIAGHTELPLYRKGILESTVDNLLADAVREAAGTDIGISNGFRFSYPVMPGKVTVEDVYNMFPMDANIKVGELTGRQLREFWEKSLDEVYSRDAYGQRGGWGPRVSGMEIRIRTDAPRGERVVWMKVAGKPVEDDRRYTVASCDRPGDPAEVLCRFDRILDSRVLDTTVQQALKAYFEQHQPVAPPMNRITAQDVDGKVWSQYELANQSR